MAKSTTIVKRKTGRPVDIGADKFVGLRLPDALLKRIDGWAKQKRIHERSKALRALIEKGLEKLP
jgi:hypothetical protein